MVAAAATSSFFPVPSPSGGDSKAAKLGSSQNSLKTNAQAPSKINGSPVGLTAAPCETLKKETDALSHHPRTFINQLPDWSMLLAAITTVFLAAEKQWMMLDWKPRRPDGLMDTFGLGRIVQDGLMFRQNFSIRSYEIGADRTASIETLMNHLQETALNHVKTAGLLDDGFGSTPEMCKRNLIWVVTRMQVLVEKYPTWGDVVEVDTWVSESGKNGMRRDWIVRDGTTGKILTRASSVWVLINKVTRKLSKLPEEVRSEILPYFLNSDPVVEEDSRKLLKLNDETVDYVRKGLSPRWNDLDVNQHVNNVKYIGWLLESVPLPILEHHELASVTLEYRRECGRDSVLKSLTAVSGSDIGGIANSGQVECQHMLQLEDGAEILRARTEWRPKSSDVFNFMAKIPAETLNDLDHI